jgi:hypothetical protein
MGTWNNNDREESKPTWLTAAQKRFCVRTTAGWELPVANSLSNLAGQFEGTRTLGATSSYPQMELIVAMPNDPVAPFGVNGVTGTTNSAFANRLSITGGWTSGDLLVGQGITNYSPYITTPFNGDGATSGGNSGLGLSHSATANFGLNQFGVSSLFWGTTGLGLTNSVPTYTNVVGTVFPAGNTGYIKVKANDVNFTQNLVLTVTGNMTGGGPALHSDLKRITFVTGSTLLTNTGANGIPTAVYETFFGPTSTYNSDIGVVILPAGLTSGAYGLTATVYDGSTAGAASGTGNASFRVTVR